jgi:aquaporin Z
MSEKASRADINEWVPNLLVELIGTFSLIFVGVSAIALAPQNIVAIALAQGLAIGVMVAATGHISGGAFNPAVTLALLVARKLNATKAALYVVAQLFGAVLAAWAVTAVFQNGTAVVAAGTPAVGTGFSSSNAFVAEIITTFFLAYVIFGVAIDKRGPATIAGLVIGLTITMDILATGGISGAAMNPARWFGPALVGNAWSNAWIWIFAPLGGALLAAVVYFYVYLQAKTE